MHILLLWERPWSRLGLQRKPRPPCRPSRLHTAASRVGRNGRGRYGRLLSGPSFARQPPRRLSAERERRRELPRWPRPPTTPRHIAQPPSRDIRLFARSRRLERPEPAKLCDMQEEEGPLRQAHAVLQLSACQDTMHLPGPRTRASPAPTQRPQCPTEAAIERARAGVDEEAAQVGRHR